MKKRFIGKRKKNVKFKPNRAYVQKAVSEYLENGGEIQRIEFDDMAFQSFMASSENPDAVDEFLRG